jgi:hypothetical protein
MLSRSHRQDFPKLSILLSQMVIVLSLDRDLEIHFSCGELPNKRLCLIDRSCTPHI